jgi:hypothetical protein
VWQLEEAASQEDWNSIVREFFAVDLCAPLSQLAFQRSVYWNSGGVTCRVWQLEEAASQEDWNSIVREYSAERRGAFQFISAEGPGLPVQNDWI